MQESRKAKSNKCKAFLIWHIKWLIIVLWPVAQQSANRVLFELFALLAVQRFCKDSSSQQKLLEVRTGSSMRVHQTLSLFPQMSERKKKKQRGWLTRLLPSLLP